MKRRMLLALSLALFLPLSLLAQAAPTTVYVVRHAEKGPENPDPSLTPAGQKRAAELSRVLEGVPVTALFASEFKRTQETVAPLAARLNLTTVVTSAGKMDDLIAKIRALPPGSQVVVASHSNLVHVIVEKLTGTKVPMLTDLEYDRLAVVTLGTPASVVVLRYGER